MNPKQFNKLSFEARLQYISHGFPTVTTFITTSGPSRLVRILAVQQFFVEEVYTIETRTLEAIYAFKTVGYLSKYPIFRGSLESRLRRSLDVSLLPTREAKLFSAPFEFSSEYNDLDGLLLSFQCMDAEGLLPLLRDGRRYDGMDRHDFIIYCDRIFRDLMDKGDTQLLMDKAVCGECQKCGTVYVFTGNVSGFRHAVDVAFDGESITDVYRCSNQSDWLDWMMPF